MVLIRGLVVDAEGEPVSGASVYFVSTPVPLPDIAQLTGSDGTVLMTAPVPGKYVVGARAESAGSGQAEVESPVGGEVTLTIALR